MILLVFSSAAYRQNLVTGSTRSELRKVQFLTPSVRGFWATICKTVRSMQLLSDRCPVCL